MHPNRSAAAKIHSSERRSCAAALIRELHYTIALARPAVGGSLTNDSRLLLTGRAYLLLSLRNTLRGIARLLESLRLADDPPTTTPLSPFVLEEGDDQGLVGTQQLLSEGQVRAELGLPCSVG